MVTDGSCISRSMSGVDAREQLYTAEFWYSRRSALAFLAALFLLVQSLSYLIPPFQSPDEFYHLKRAYLLSAGTVLLDKENGVSGGYIDTGLLDYMSHYRQGQWFFYAAADPPSKAKPALAKEIRWSGRVAFSDVPNVAVYFPLPYLPQAIAFVVGKSTGLTVASSYYLARWLSLVAALSILCAACFLYPVPPLVAVLFLMPMTIYQLGSASLDGVSFSTVALTGALYMRAATKEYSFTTGMQIFLALCLFSLATTRINLIVLTVLPAALYTVRRSYSYFITSGVALLLSLAWTFFAVSTVSGGHGNAPEVRSQMTTYYLHHPGSFLEIVVNTLTNASLLSFYWRMFVGVFGWSGIEFSDGGTFKEWGIFLSPVDYVSFGLLLAIVTCFSFRWRLALSLCSPSIWLVVATVLSACLILPILLVTWTPQAAKFIFGIQGRYFIPTVILLSFALPGARLVGNSAMALRALLLLAAIISVTVMPPVLLSAWWGN